MFYINDMKICEIKNGNNQIYALVKKIQEKTSRINMPFLNITLSDKTGEIIAKLFNTSQNDFSAHEGDIIFIEFEHSLYNGNISNKILNYSICNSQEFRAKDYMYTSNSSAEYMFDECINVINNISDKELKNLVFNIYNDNKEQLLIWGAAKTIHHNVTSGLLWHTYRMLLIARNMVSIYNNINTEILYAGILLHDIGKLKELSTNKYGASEYTVEGTLFGHSLLGIDIVKSYANNTNISEETLKCLLHIIASHHGDPAYGAISRPATSEAYLIHEIDTIDSRMYIYEKETNNLKPGNITDNMIIDNAKIYRPKLALEMKEC